MSEPFEEFLKSVKKNTEATNIKQYIEDKHNTLLKEQLGFYLDTELYHTYNQMIIEWYNSATRGHAELLLAYDFFFVSQNSENKYPLFNLFESPHSEIGLVLMYNQQLPEAIPHETIDFGTENNGNQKLKTFISKILDDAKVRNYIKQIYEIDQNQPTP